MCPPVIKGSLPETPFEKHSHVGWFSEMQVPCDVGDPVPGFRQAPARFLKPEFEKITGRRDL